MAIRVSPAVAVSGRRHDDGRSRRNRPANSDLSRSPRTATTRSEPAYRQRPHAGRASEPGAPSGAHSGLGSGRLRAGGAAAGRNRHLRCDVLCGLQTHPRDRRPDGVGGASERRVEAGHGAGSGADADRRGDRVAGSFGADPLDEERAVRRERDRSIDLRGRRGVAHHCGAAGLLHPGATGDEGGPDGRPEMRLGAATRRMSTNESNMSEWQQEIRERLAPLKLQPIREAEIVEELSQHLEDRYSELLAGGAEPEEAYRAAFAELSGSELLAQELRRVERSTPQEPVVLGSNGRSNMFGGMWQDARFAIRMLRKNPGFTAVAALTLALGIGANTAIFTLIDAVLLKNLPVKQPEQLIELMTGSGDPGARVYNSFSWQAFQHWRERNQTLSGLIASSNSRFYCVVEGAPPERIAGQYVTGDFFSVLGVSPVIGRTITPDDDRYGAPNAVAVISDGYWARRFGRDPAALGKRIVVEDVPLTIVGVAPAEFLGLQVGSRVDLWAPLATEPLMRRTSWTSSSGYKWLQLVGRIKPGASLDQARADLDLLFRPAVIEPDLALQITPETRRMILNWKLRVEPAGAGLSQLRRQFSKPLTVLMVVVGLVLLIACANLANLLLARAASRQREIAVRLALGAGRARLIRQLVTESLLLALIGAAAGILLAGAGTQYLLKILESGRTSVLIDAQPDARALVYTGMLSVMTALLFGLAPALRASRTDLIPALKEGGRGLEFGGSRRRLSRGLIVAQVALSLVLLVGAGLFLRTLRNLHSIDLGFERENALLVALDPSHSGYTPDQTRGLFLGLLERLQAIPGVLSASLSWNPPVAGGGSSRTVS